jgi:4-amino-4-deoxy-L-arabinose transferase-like glycosyltransferase
LTTVLGKVRLLLTSAEESLGRLDRPSLVIGALSSGTLAQGILTRSTTLAAGTLVGIAGLYVLSSQCERHRDPHRSDRLTVIFLLLLLVGGALTLMTFSSFGGAIPLYAMAVVLFVSGVGREEKDSASKTQPYTRREIVLLILIITLGFTLQSYRVALIPPGFHGDEGESGLQALKLLHGEVPSLISVGWYHLPMMSFAWHAVSMRIFGETIYGLRMSSVIVGTLTLIPFYFLVRLLFDKKTALVAAFLLAVSHPFIALSRLGINYTQTTLFEVTTFYFLFRGLRTRRWWDFVLSGLFMGAGLYLYYASRLVPLIVAGFLVYATIARRDFVRARWQGVVILSCTAMVIFAPMAVYFVRHPWHFMSRTNHVFVLAEQGWVDAPYPRSNAVFTLLGQASRVLPLFNYGGDMSGQYGYRGPMLDFFTSILFVLGLGYSAVHIDRPRHFFLLLWFWATLIAGGILTLPAPFVPRLVGILPVLSIFASVVIVRTMGLFAQRCAGVRGSRAALGVLLAVAFAGVACLNYDIYFNQYLHTVQGWAMREPATAIARYLTSLGDDYEAYLLGEPKLYVRHGTIRFIARQVEGTDVLEPSQYIPLRDSHGKDAAYVLLPSHLHHLATLQQYYPRGVVRNFTRETGELWFTTFEVSREDIAAVSPVAH